MNIQEKYEHRIRTVMPESHEYKYLFSDLSENKAYYQKCINQTVNAVLDHLEHRHTPFTGRSVSSLKEAIDKIYLDDTSMGDRLSEVLHELKTLYLDDAVSFHQPKYVAHLNCPILIPALAAEVIISSLNTSMDTWDQSAGGTLIEQKLIDWTLDKIHYPVDGDGVFTSGGTQSNMVALLLARDHYVLHHFGIDPKMDGLPPEASRFKIFCSEVSHFSLEKNAALLGLGQSAVVAVPVNEHFQMDISALEQSIETNIRDGNIPIAVVGTAGTTDFGSIDPLREIADVARRHALWFHVDAAYGGGLILSDMHRHKLQGIEMSDSATIDYHKSFFQPVSSSGFLMRDKRNIGLISYHADYLNPKEHDMHDAPNLVDKSIQTTRRFDALKLWFTLRVMGKKRLGKYIDDIMTLTTQTAETIRETGMFEVLHQPELSAIVFRYVPPLPNAQLNYCALNSFIRKSMFEEGKALLASTKIKGEVFLKFTLLNPVTTLADMCEIIEMICAHGEKYIRQNC